MYVLVLPVSGGGFGSQLAILQHLCESQFIPDLTLASSGGNVAAYIAAAANWKWAGIERISREINHTLFISPWNNITLLSFILGYFNGNVYNKGSGATDFMSRHFTSTSIKKYEIWTGTYSKNRQQARLFCNRSQATSILDTTFIDHELTHSMKPVFTDGNIQLIAEAGVASASIPGLVPSQKILGEEHVDGGVGGASPLTIMQEPILKHTRDNKTPLHIVYVNCIDLSKTDISPSKNVLDTLKQATADLVRTQNVNDRLSAYQLLRCHPGTVHKEEFVCNYENLERIKKVRTAINYSLLEIYPTENIDIDLTKFNGDDVIKAIRDNYPLCRCRFWWLTSDEVPEDVQVLLKACKAGSKHC
jgi:predicted acylesterase/phospholipase RssA